MYLGSLRLWQDGWTYRHPNLHVALILVVVIFTFVASALFIVALAGGHSINDQPRQQALAENGFDWIENPYQVNVIKSVAMNKDLAHFLVRDERDLDGQSFWVIGPQKYVGNEKVLIVDGVRQVGSRLMTDGIVVGVLLEE